jgi:D-alanine-D-alanine ligase
MKNILILHNTPLANRDDEADTLVQVAEVSSALEALNYNHNIGSVSSLIDVENLIKKHQPQLVFNLVESFCGSDKDSYLIPAYLDSQEIAFTGCPTNALFLARDKVLAKKIMRAFNISTPVSLDDNFADVASLSKKTFIVKSVTEHASFGMDSDSLAEGVEATKKLIQKKEQKFGGKWFAEQYIDGREFSVAIIGKQDSPVILPPSELVFQNFPEDTPKFFTYEIKWDVKSPLYDNVFRNFISEEQEPVLFKRIKEAALQCWEIFGTSGYARFDFRTDAQGNPYVMDVNMNPCLNSDAGFIATMEEYGMNYIQTINHIMEIADNDYNAQDAKTNIIG